MSARALSTHRFGNTTFALGGTLEQKLAAMRLAGYVATELFPRDVFEDPRGPDYCVELLRDSALEVSAYEALRDYEGMPTQQRDHVLGIAEQMMDQMAWIGADLLVLCANTHLDASGDIARCVEDLHRLTTLAAARGLRVAYEPIGWARHHGDYRLAWDLVRAVDQPNFGIVLDSLHVAARGLPLAPISEFDPTKIFLVQLCDWPRANLPPFEIARHYRLFPGEGVGPLAEFVRRVVDVGYRGIWSVEVMNAHYLHQAPEAVARRGFEATLALLAAASGRAG